MATDKIYTVAGVSTQNGETKARFANDVMRIKVLAKNGHTDIQLVELPNAMSKVDAAKFIAALPEYAGAAAQAAISEYLGKHDRTPKVAVKAAVKKAVENKPAKTTVKAKEDENQPF